MIVDQVEKIVQPNRKVARIKHLIKFDQSLTTCSSETDQDIYKIC